MIEIIPEKPDIKDELARAAAGVIKDYCKSKETCHKCCFSSNGWDCCIRNMLPEAWSFPERGNLNGKTD